MSIALMNLAWKLDIHHAQKMVLLALCDNANDQGECYPSISTLVRKCSMSERGIQNHIKALEKAGIVTREMRTGRSTIYHLTPANYAPPQTMHPRTVCTPPPHSLHPTPANCAPITIIEPSSNQKNKRVYAKPDEVSDQTWNDFLLIRKAKKAPITETSMNAIKREADKAGYSLEEAIHYCCERNWQSFKAEWVPAKLQAVKDYI